jgi:hypothetical protein
LTVDDKGGSESSVKLAKADLVPTCYNLREDYSSFAELELACAGLSDELNRRPHSVTRRAPAEMLAEERGHLHAVPDVPYTAAFGESRAVGWSSTVSFRGARYSVPHTLAGGQVWVRASAGEVVIVAGVGSSAHEVARHPAVPAGHASIADEHYPERAEALPRAPRPTNSSEAAFLALGEGAKLYLLEAAAAGVRRLQRKMAEAVTLASLQGSEVVDRALGVAAMAGRFAEGDLESIICHSQAAPPAGLPPVEHSLQAGTAAWAGLGEKEEETR